MEKFHKSQENLICSCPVQTTTTHHEHFLPYNNIKKPILHKLQKPRDIELITGYIGDNLKINSDQTKSKVWPDVLLHSENYEDFLKRLKDCEKHIYNLYFKSLPVDKEIINKLFKNLNKTTYQIVFSPDAFTPRTEKRRFAKLKNQPIRMNYEETTYATYFSRIKELQSFKEILQGLAIKENKEDLRNELKLIKYCGRSTYYDEVSVLGKLYSKPTLPGPIDRYTLRQI